MLDDDMTEMLADKGRALTDRARRFKGTEITSLCGRCQRAHIIKVKRKNDPSIHCMAIERDVPWDIEECSKFQQIGVLDVWDLAKLAKIIDIDERKVGIQV